jgi:hypothetical protein
MRPNRKIKNDYPMVELNKGKEFKEINREKAESIGFKGLLIKPVVKLEMVQMVRNCWTRIGHHCCDI